MALFHNAETFASQKSVIFLVLPDPSKNFMAGLMIQTLSRELFSVADEHGGKLPNRVVLFCDELGTMPAFDILPLFSAGRSRKLTLVPIIQSLAQLEKNYGKEGAEIIQDNVQDLRSSAVSSPTPRPARCCPRRWAAARTVAYANKQQLENAVFQSRVAPAIPEQAPPGISGRAAGTGRWG